MALVNITGSPINWVMTVRLPLVSNSLASARLTVMTVILLENFSGSSKNVLVVSEVVYVNNCTNQYAQKSDILTAIWMASAKDTGSSNNWVAIATLPRVSISQGWGERLGLSAGRACAGARNYVEVAQQVRFPRRRCLQEAHQALAQGVGTGCGQGVHVRA